MMRILKREVMFAETELNRGLNSILIILFRLAEGIIDAINAVYQQRYTIP